MARYIKAFIICKTILKHIWRTCPPSHVVWVSVQSILWRRCGGILQSKWGYWGPQMSISDWFAICGKWFAWKLDDNDSGKKKKKKTMQRKWIKGIVHPKRKFLSSFTDPHVVLKLQNFPSFLLLLNTKWCILKKLKKRTNINNQKFGISKILFYMPQTCLYYPFP